MLDIINNKNILLNIHSKIVLNTTILIVIDFYLFIASLIIEI